MLGGGLVYRDLVQTCSLQAIAGQMTAELCVCMCVCVRVCVCERERKRVRKSLPCFILAGLT